MTVNPVKKRRYKIRRVYSAPSPVQREMSPARKLYILLTVICMAGAVTGAYSFSVFPCDSSELIPMGKGFTAVFVDSLAAVLAYVLICFFSGLSAAGQPVGYILCAVKGMAAGYLSACAVSSGNLAVILDILPFQAVCTVTVILAARENIRLSGYISDRSFGSGGGNGDSSLGLYMSKFGIICLTALGAAAVDSIGCLIGSSF